MIKNETLIVLSSLIIGMSGIVFAQNQDEWQKISQGLNENQIYAVAVDPINKGLLYVGTESGLYFSNNNGDDFTAVIDMQGRANKVNDIYIDPLVPDKVFVTTERGLFVGNGANGIWNKIYESGPRGSGVCLSVMVYKHKLYLGTSQGLYETGLDTQSWTKVPGRLGNEVVYEMARDREFLYLSAASELFRLDQEQRVEKVFSAFSKNAEVEDDYEEIELAPRKITDIFVVDQIDPVIYVSKEAEIYLTKDQCRTWQRLNMDGHMPFHINQILILADKSHGQAAPGQDDKLFLDWGLTMYAATEEGVFKYFENRWKPIYQGLESNHINSIVTDAEGDLYVGTDRGLFFMSSEKAVPSLPLRNIDYDMVGRQFSNEPTIREVQEIAIAYAEVDKEKIDTWRRQAMKKAWLPAVSIGMDSAKNKTTGDSIWGSYTSGGQLYIGPDDKTFYDNFGWDVSLSWDLGDIIWNSDQTSIDSRSKLMVELREDVLDQITRLYFERRRLQCELTACDTAGTCPVFDKKMRIEELTALIDALTGGEFSKRIEMNTINNY